MKKFLLASSILLALAACDTLGLPHVISHDAVPESVKQQPRLIEMPLPTMPDESGWPRLGDVPSKPSDFTPPVANNHYMNEMEFYRDEGRAAKMQAQDENPAITDSSRNVLRPPQLPTR